MKNIKTFEGFFDFSKVKKDEIKDYGGEGGVNAPLMPKYAEREITSNDNDVYCFFTKEQLERKKGQKHTSYAHDAYHMTFKSKKELEELKIKYPVGGTYNGETIERTTTMNSKNLRQ